MVGKYTGLSDAYLSVLKALQHACLAASRKLEVLWVEASHLESPPEARALASIRAQMMNIPFRHVPGQPCLMHKSIISSVCYVHPLRAPHCGAWSMCPLQQMVQEGARITRESTNEGSGEQ